MNRIAVFMLAAFAITACDKKNIPLDSDTRKSSYAIGQQIGKSIKSQGVEVDVDVVAMSIQDAIDDKSKMTDEELGKAIQAMREGMMKKKSEEAEKNKTEGAKYLEENKKKDGVKTTASGLQYEVITAGKGKKPSKDSTVKVHYKGTLINGEEFDSSYKRDRPAEFPVQGVISGWTEALQLMKEGAKWKLTIPSDLAYGPRGRPGIPANSTLIFEVELLEIVKKK